MRGFFHFNSYGAGLLGHPVHPLNGEKPLITFNFDCQSRSLAFSGMINVDDWTALKWVESNSMVATDTKTFEFSEKTVSIVA